MEKAESFTFTRANPAPAWRPGAQGGRPGPEVAPCQCLALDMLSVEATVLLAEAGLRPALLNFAHSYNCGGGFEHCAGSQEEDIFRKSSAFLSLWPHRRADDGPGVLRRSMWIGEFDAELERKTPFYPHSECGGLYSPHVRAVLDLPEDASSLPSFAVLTVAAQNVNWDPPFNSALLREKLRTALWIASAQRHEAVVLGAFGCGAFHNPAGVVAKTFQELLGPGGEFEYAFRLALFAVPSFGPWDENPIAFSAIFPPVDEEAALRHAQVVASRCDPPAGPPGAAVQQRRSGRWSRGRRDADSDAGALAQRQRGTLVDEGEVPVGSKSQSGCVWPCS